MCFHRTILLLAWASLGLSCAPAESKVVVCSDDGDCPIGARCEASVCTPNEFTPLPVAPSPDVGVDAGPPPGRSGDAASDAGPGIEADIGRDTGPVDASLQPLELAVERPAEGERVAGVTRLSGRVTTEPGFALRSAVFRWGDEVIGEESTRLVEQGAGVYLVELEWPTEAVADGPYEIRLEVSDSGERSAQSEPRPFRVYNHPERVQVEGERFVLRGRSWGMVAVSYLAERELSGDALLADLQGVSEAGFNTLEIEAPAAEFELAENVFDLSVCAPLRALLDAAEEVELKVLIRLPALADYPWLIEAHPAYGSSTAVAVDGKARSALARRHLNLLERCSLEAREALLGFELLRALRAGDLAGRSTASAVAAWEAWGLARYGGAAARDEAWGIRLAAECGEGATGICPPPTAALCAGPGAVPSPAALDYREFMSDAAESAVGDLVERLRPAVGFSLLTVGYQSSAMGGADAAAQACEGHGGYIDPRRGVESLDFVSTYARPWAGVPVAPQEGLAPVGYEAFSDDFMKLEFLALYARVGLPVVMRGLGYDAWGVPEGELVKQGVLARALDGAIYLGAAGVGIERWRSRGEESDEGLMRLDGGLSPAADAVTGRAQSLASPAPWEAEVEVVAPAGRYLRFYDVVVAGLGRYAGAREDGAKVGVVSCAQTLSAERCEVVLGCTDLCQSDGP